MSVSRHRLLDGVIDPVKVGGAHVALQRRDVRLVGVVQSPALRHALEQPGVDLAGALDGVLVGIDQDIDGGQIAHAARSF